MSAGAEDIGEPKLAVTDEVQEFADIILALKTGQKAMEEVVTLLCSQVAVLKTELQGILALSESAEPGMHEVVLFRVAEKLRKILEEEE